MTTTTPTVTTPAAAAPAAPIAPHPTTPLPPPAPAATAAPVAPAPKIVPVHNGQDIAAILASAQPGTVLQVEPSAAITCHATVLIAAAHVTVDGSAPGASLDVIPSKKVNTVFNVRAANFTLKGFSKITGTAETTLVIVAAPYAAVQGNTSAAGLLKFVETETGGDYCQITANHIGKTGSVSVFGVTSHCTVCGNAFEGSYGEYVLRWVADTNAQGFPIYGPDGALVRAIDLKVIGNTLIDHNDFGKQCMGLRAIDGAEVEGNIFDGAIRLGEPAPAGSTPAAAGRCHNLLLTKNTFRNAYGMPPSAPTTAIQACGGCTGVITANTFEPTACAISPVAVAAGNSLAVTANLLQIAPGGKAVSCVAPSSVAGTFSESGNLVQVPAPLATAPAAGTK